MTEVLTALLCLAIMVACFWAGLAIQPFLRDHHRSRESVDSIRVLITLLVTFAALVLGLLISSAQSRYSSLSTGLRSFSVDIAQLDQRMREYGPELDPLRARLILYTKASIADTWPDETPPPGDYPRQLRQMATGSIESVELSTLLNQIDIALHRLQPADDYHRLLAGVLQRRMQSLLEQRWDLIENAPPTLSWPFIAILMFWLAVIFVITGLSSPRNLVVVVVVLLGAVSLSSSIFLMLDLDTPMSGFIAISSAPLRDALLHITQPPLPPGAP